MQVKSVMGNLEVVWFPCGKGFKFGMCGWSKPGNFRWCALQLPGADDGGNTCLDWWIGYQISSLLCLDGVEFYILLTLHLCKQVKSIHSHSWLVPYGHGNAFGCQQMTYLLQAPQPRICSCSHSIYLVSPVKFLTSGNHTNVDGLALSNCASTERKGI